MDGWGVRQPPSLGSSIVEPPLRSRHSSRGDQAEDDGHSRRESSRGHAPQLAKAKEEDPAKGSKKRSSKEGEGSRLLSPEERAEKEESRRKRRERKAREAAEKEARDQDLLVAVGRSSYVKLEKDHSGVDERVRSPDSAGPSNAGKDGPQGEAKKQRSQRKEAAGAQLSPEELERKRKRKEERRKARALEEAKVNDKDNQGGSVRVSEGGRREGRVESRTFESKDGQGLHSTMSSHIEDPGHADGLELHGAYVWDETTNTLTNTLGTGASAPVSDVKNKSMFIEGATDGTFHRVDTSERSGWGLWRFWNARSWQRQTTDTELATTISGGGVILKVLSDNINSIAAILALCSQCLLGGFALLNLYMTYLFNLGTMPGGFLAYYAPIAVDCQRTFLVLTSISLLAACDKYAKDKLLMWRPRGGAQQREDALLIVAYLVAFVLSVVGAPFEDLLYYSNNRVPGWYKMEPLNAKFKSNLSAWHVLNFFRLLACGVGFATMVHDFHGRKVEIGVKLEKAAQWQKAAATASLASRVAQLQQKPGS